MNDTDVERTSVSGFKFIKCFGSEVPDINYFLTLIKHYFFSQFYNYKKNKSLQIKAFSQLKSWYWCSFNISIIHNQIQKRCITYALRIFLGGGGAGPPSKSASAYVYIQ
jgi:hypothetical protein